MRIWRGDSTMIKLDRAVVVEREEKLAEYMLQTN